MSGGSALDWDVLMCFLLLVGVFGRRRPAWRCEMAGRRKVAWLLLPLPLCARGEMSRNGSVLGERRIGRIAGGGHKAGDQGG